VTKSLLCTYLGDDPGRRVFNGSCDRGDCTTVESVIWFSDITDFTVISGFLGEDDLLSLLNDVMGITETVLRKHGADILKMMGDGVLAIFPEAGTHLPPPCERARMAAEDFEEEMREMRRRRGELRLAGKETTAYVGLHYGKCSYGNIGGTTRLERQPGVPDRGSVFKASS